MKKIMYGIFDLCGSQWFGTIVGLLGLIASVIGFFIGHAPMTSYIFGGISIGIILISICYNEFSKFKIAGETREKLLNEKIYLLELENKNLRPVEDVKIVNPDIVKEASQVIRLYLQSILAMINNIDYNWDHTLSSLVKNISIFHIIGKHIPSIKDKAIVFEWMQENSWINSYEKYTILLPDNTKVTAFIAISGSKLVTFLSEMEKTTTEMMKEGLNWLTYQNEKINTFNC